MQDRAQGYALTRSMDIGLLAKVKVSVLSKYSKFLLFSELFVINYCEFV